MSIELTKIYVTKYALSKGPFVVDAEVKKDGDMAFFQSGGYRNYAHGKEFWLIEEEAIADCERRRQAKIKSIEKQKYKLEKMTFTIRELKA